MWNEGGYDNAGGFYEPTQGGAQTPGGAEKKRARAQNLVPVGVQTILSCGKFFAKLLNQILLSYLAKLYTHSNLQ